MFDKRASARDITSRDDDIAAPVPGRTTRTQASDDDASMFDGAQWEELSPARGEQMLAGLAPAPGAPDLDEDSDEDAEVRDDRDAADEAESSEPTASAARRPRVPGSAFATQHNKVMRNFAFRPGTTITNTTADADGDFGGPNTDPNELDDVKSRGRERKTLLKTVSVDISTVVGGKRANQFRDGWVLTFHKTQIKRGKKRVRADSGDHTGWIRVGDLSSRGIAAVAKYQQKMRKELGRGKGSGHKAKVRGPAKTIAPTNPASINGNAPRPADYFKFKVRGGSAETSLGNYTVNPKRYGSGVIIGVWNPPGSGADGKRFGGSGGVRAFVPIGTEIRLAATRALTIPDVTGTATATWRYVRVVLDNQPVYCWLLESWQTPKGSGSNF